MFLLSYAISSNTWILTMFADLFRVCSVVVGARNRTYPIPIPCSELVPEPIPEQIPMLESIPIPESIPEPIPETISEPIPEPIPELTPEPIPQSESAPESELAWES